MRVFTFCKSYLLVVIFFQFFLFSCNISSENRAFDGIIDVATLKGPSAISMVEMIDDPPVFFDSIHTQFIIKDEPSQVQAMILNNQVEFAIIPTTLAAILYNRGARYKIAAIPVWGTLYLFGIDSLIQTWDDLRGKRIYLMERGMTPDAMFRFLLFSNGLDPEKDVTLDYSFPSHQELARAVAANKAPLAVISEPMVSLVMRQNKNVKPLFDLNSEWLKATNNNIPYAQTSLVVQSDFADAHPELVDAFLKDYEKSITWINSNAYQAAGLIAKYKILPDTLMAVSAIPRCNLMFKAASDVENGVLKYLTIFFNFDSRIIGGKLPSEDIFYKNGNKKPST